MRDYGQIQCSFWGHPDMGRLSDQGKVLAVYLLSGPHSNGLGCYRLPNAYLQADLGWDAEKVESAFKEIESCPISFCLRCPVTHFVFIRKYLKWNPIANGKVAIARRKEFEDIPSSFSLFYELASDMIEHGKHWEEDLETRLSGIIRSRSDTVSDHDRIGLQDRDLIPYAKQEPNLTEPNRTFSCAKDGSHVDTETGEILQWGGVQ